MTIMNSLSIEKDDNFNQLLSEMIKLIDVMVIRLNNNSIRGDTLRRQIKDLIKNCKDINDFRKSKSTFICTSEEESKEKSDEGSVKGSEEESKEESEEDLTSRALEADEEESEEESEPDLTSRAFEADDENSSDSDMEEGFSMSESEADADDESSDADDEPYEIVNMVKEEFFDLKYIGFLIGTLFISMILYC